MNDPLLEVCFRLNRLRQVERNVHHSIVSAEIILSHSLHGKETILPQLLLVVIFKTCEKSELNKADIGKFSTIAKEIQN